MVSLIVLMLTSLHLCHQGLKQVAYEVVEDMMANALAPSFVPTTTEERY